MGLHIEPHSPVRLLNTAEKQSVVIATALSSEVKILIMDELTTALTGDEVDELFEVVRNLADQGVAIIHVSHKMDEIFSLADRVTVLRDGEKVGTLRIAESNPDTIISLMTGKTMSELYPPKSNSVKDEVVLAVNQATVKESFSSVSFELRRGEILGIYGMMGSGAEEIGRALFGHVRLDSGTVEVGGKKIRCPKEAIQFGLGFVPSDRRMFQIAVNEALYHTKFAYWRLLTFLLTLSWFAPWFANLNRQARGMTRDKTT